MKFNFEQEPRGIGNAKKESDLAAESFRVADEVGRAEAELERVRERLSDRNIPQPVRESLLERG